MTHEGIVKSFNYRTEYGFVGTPVVDGDVFIHARAVVGRQALRIGQTVSFELERTERGYRAQCVRIVKKAVET